MNRTNPLIAREATTAPVHTESSGVIRMLHSIDGKAQEPRIYDMRRQSDRESFVKFASWASRNSVDFNCFAL